MHFHENYRPRNWSDVVGQDKVIAKIEWLRTRGLAGRAYRHPASTLDALSLLSIVCIRGGHVPVVGVALAPPLEPPRWRTIAPRAHRHHLLPYRHGQVASLVSAP